jgi:hypothetical protein
MRLARICAAIALLGVAGRSRAQDPASPERHPRAGMVLRDTVAGGVLGCGVAGAIIFYEMGIQDREDYGWERTLAWGAAIGLGAGLVWGLVAAARAPGPPTTVRARAPVRDGQSMSLDLRRRDQSGVQEFTLVRRRF